MENSSKKNRRVIYPFIVVALLALLAVGFFDNQMIGKKRLADSTDKDLKIQKEEFKFWTWIVANQGRTDESYIAEFRKYSENGFDAVLINMNADPNLLSRLVALANGEGLEVHAWVKGGQNEKHGALTVLDFTPEELETTIDLIQKSGARGISIFDGPALTAQHLEVIRKASIDRE